MATPFTLFTSDVVDPVNIQFAQLTQGGSVAVWLTHADNPAPQGHQIYVTHFASDGRPTGLEIELQPDPVPDPLGPDSSVKVAPLLDGGYVIGFRNRTEALSEPDPISFQRFDASGARVDSVVFSSVMQMSLQFGTLWDLQPLPDGGWLALTSEAQSGVITASLFDPFGQSRQDIDLLPQQDGLRYAHLTATVLSDGRLALTYEAREEADGVPNRLLTQLFDAAMTPLGPPVVQANLGETFLRNLDVTLLENGDIALVWQSFGAAETTVTVLSPNLVPRGASGALTVDDTAGFGNLAPRPEGGFVLSFNDDAQTIVSFDALGQPTGSLSGAAGLSPHERALGDSVLALDGGGLLHVAAPAGFSGAVLTRVLGQGTAGNDILSLTPSNPDGLQAGGLALGLEGHDLITGSALGDHLLGGAGSDTLRGGGGHDSLFLGAADETRVQLAEGQAGNDLLRDGDSGSILRGGAGFDTLRGRGGDDSLDGGGQRDLLQGGAGADRALGGAGDDRLELGTGNDTGFGQDGRDTLFGGSGEDHLEGGRGADILYGGEADDLLYGGGWKDTLNGGTGDDLLTGGADADRFVFNTAGFGQDTITDFQQGTDKIVIGGALASGFAGLNIQMIGSSTHIQLSGGEIVILDTASGLQESDFIF